MAKTQKKMQRKNAKKKPAAKKAVARTRTKPAAAAKPKARRPIPTVSKYMTASPHTIGRALSLATAHQMMRDHGIRHLPVLDMGQIVGVVTDRDLALVESMPGVDPTDVRVEEAMTTNTYVVAPRAPLPQVVTEMAERRLGSAVVAENDRVVGIFTTVDALRALADEFKGSGG